MGQITDKTLEAQFAKLSPEDRGACERDMQIHGRTFIRQNEAGELQRVPLSDVQLQAIGKHIVPLKRKRRKRPKPLTPEN